MNFIQLAYRKNSTQKGEGNVRINRQVHLQEALARAPRGAGLYRRERHLWNERVPPVEEWRLLRPQRRVFQGSRLAAPGPGPRRGLFDSVVHVERRLER